MSLYKAAVRWTGGADFAAGRYSRDHDVVFDGVTVRGSAALANVPPNTASFEAVDPEELFVASLAQCHLLWFLDLARQAGVTVTAYEDEAEGLLSKNAQGRLAMTRVTLRPRVTSNATAAQLADLHHRTHEVCFIANSVKTEVVVAFQT